MIGLVLLSEGSGALILGLRGLVGRRVVPKLWSPFCFSWWSTPSTSINLSTVSFSHKFSYTLLIKLLILFLCYYTIMIVLVNYKSVVNIWFSDNFLPAFIVIIIVNIAKFCIIMNLCSYNVSQQLTLIYSQH